MSLNKALTVGQLIVDAHPTDVRQLFQSYGITTKPTGKSVLDAYIVYGKPFLDRMINIAFKSMNQSAFSSATGDTTSLFETNKLLSNAQSLANTANAQQTALDQSTASSGISNWFNSALSVLNQSSGLYQTISNIFSGKSVNTGATTSTQADAALQQQIYQAQLDAQKAQSANQTKTYLLIGAGVLVLILAVIMFNKKR